MQTSSQTTDKGIGVTMLFGAIAVIGAFLMAITAPAAPAAWGFAIAMIFGLCAVVAIHLYA